MPLATRAVLKTHDPATPRHAGPEQLRRSSILRPARDGLVALLLAGCLVLLPGCTVDVGHPTPPPFPEGVSAELVQLRSDVADRQAQVRVRNGTDATIEVGSVTVADPRFRDIAERVNADRVSRIAPGREVDIRIQLPPVACDVPDGSATVQLVLAHPEAPVDREGLVEGLLPDPLNVIGPLQERECRAERVTDAAALAFASFEPSRPGEPATLTLSIAPTGEAAVTIVGIQTTNLLTFNAGPGATADTHPIGHVVDPATDAGAEPVEIELPLVPLRCDPHAVQEDKRGTVFTLEVEVDPSTGTGTPGSGIDSGTIELAAPEDMRGRMLSWVADWCGFGR